jgi:hypothetical protein
MTTPAALPLRLQVLNRFVVVLKAIVAGANFWLTPYDVQNKFYMFNEVQGYPFLMTFTENGQMPEYAGEQLYDETFIISVCGYVQDSTNAEAVKEKCLRDVRKAINDDSKLGTAGSLSMITVQVKPGKTETDNGIYSLADAAFFSQEFEVTISGDYGEL